MSEEQKPQPNLYEILDKLAEKQAQQQTQLDQLTKAIEGLTTVMAQRGGQQTQQGQQGGGLGDLIKVFKEMEGGSKGVDIKKIVELARYTAAMADAFDRYRRPVLPYSGADRFLMRAGARSVYRTIYTGVKSKTETEGKEEPSDEEMDKMLGFAGEKEEEKKGHEF